MSKFNNQYKAWFPILAVVLLVTFFFSMKLGAINISWTEIQTSFTKLISGEAMNLNERIFMQIRLPRALMGVFVGASLAIAGVLMQALFRNPIVEPGLIGTSSGAAFGASLYFVLGSVIKVHVGEWTLPIAACIGGTLSTVAVFLLSQNRSTGKSSVVALLLTGIAINALFLSGVGFLSYLARDPQARSIIFWNLGTLSGANWVSVSIVGTIMVVCLFFALRYAKQLNALMMGEDEAIFLGVNLKKLQIGVIALNVLLVAVATSFTGVIGFVGLVVPHLLRLMKGSDNRFLLLGSAFMGGILLSLADLASRLLLAPAELPIGIVTSLVGVPVFIILLRKKQYYF
ncbi:ABC transporter permease [Roseivirga seohaensis subsp. aquiponti]|uniref:ABC transporter permease n=1 Tax=Roseivirga seohaensis subsp. aquiponti TaxID=1566026 RepID=A0A0L8AI64_9BACT|nr:iron ABC transporter permease [Roseivirga seohaensis]KOF01845.1 ABC transporter permease [Roseivirga seohaensis subsp. aquiponti]